MELKDIIQPQNRVYKKPALLNDNNMHYCPGCSHGVVHKLVAEIIEDMGATEYAIGISPVAVPCLRIIISTSTGLRLPMVVLPLWLPP